MRREEQLSYWNVENIRGEYVKQYRFAHFTEKE